MNMNYNLIKKEMIVNSLSKIRLMIINSTLLGNYDDVEFLLGKYNQLVSKLTQHINTND